MEGFWLDSIVDIFRRYPDARVTIARPHIALPDSRYGDEHSSSDVTFIFIAAGTDPRTTIREQHIVELLKKDVV